MVEQGDDEEEAEERGQKEDGEVGLAPGVQPPALARPIQEAQHWRKATGRKRIEQFCRQFVLCRPFRSNWNTQSYSD